VPTATSVAALWRGVPHMLFLSGFTGWYEPMRPWSDVWWSLVTEVQFYVLLPLLPLCRRWRRGRWLGAALLAAYGLLYLAFQSTLLGLANPASHHLLAESIVGRGPQFLIGGAAAWLYLRWRAAPLVAAPAWWRRGGADAALLATLFALARLLEWVMAAPHRFLGPPYHAWHTLEALLWATVVLLVLLAPLRLKRLWDNPLLERLGLLSYSIYMWHVPCAWFLLQAVRGSVLRVEAHWTLRGLVVGVLAAAVCLGISALTYRVVERPFLVRKARLS
jgi:peptidoglycan/LPS O-acetylase OafA/YrhL